eukprot:8962153-Lingulodinium_polyedra.AAC.1
MQSRKPMRNCQNWPPNARRSSHSDFHAFDVARARPAKECQTHTEFMHRHPKHREIGGSKPQKRNIPRIQTST